MVRKLGLALIAAGTIGAYFSLCNLDNACNNAIKIRNEIRYSRQARYEREIDIEHNPRIQRNSAYGGFSVAGILASVFTTAGGCYLLKKGILEDLD